MCPVKVLLLPLLTFRPQIFHQQNIYSESLLNSVTLNYIKTQEVSSHRTAAALRLCRPSSAPGCGPVSCSTVTSENAGRGSAPARECVRSRGPSPWTGCAPCVRSASTSLTCRSGLRPGGAGRREPEFLLKVKQQKRTSFVCASPTSVVQNLPLHTVFSFINNSVPA